MKISIVIPVHAIEDRWHIIRKAIALADEDERIAEVLLNCEPNNTLPIRGPKVRMLHNVKREYVFRNKYLAVLYSLSEYCIILDSDNTIDKNYIDTIYAQEPWKKNTIYQPEFARPSFDFRQFSGKTITRRNVRFHLSIAMFRVMINAMNFFVCRQTFLDANKETFNSGFDPKCADSLQVNYNLLKAENEIYVVPGLQYEHKVHDGSFYKETSKTYGHLTKELEGKLCTI